MTPDYATCCILSYERPEFLTTAVSTLLANAGAPLELIVHDDGSSDPRVYDRLLEWQSAGIVSSLILNPPGHNQGQGTALNRMFNMASGDPIIKLDQDLIFAPDWLRSVQDLLAENRKYSGSYTRSSGADREKEERIGLLGLFHYHHDPVATLKCKLKQYKGWQSHTHICGSGFAVTRDCWRRLGPFEEHSEAFAEDWVFQRLVTNSEGFVCALPDADLVTNQGFGIGPSTVVLDRHSVQPINMGPLIHGR